MNLTDRKRFLFKYVSLVVSFLISNCVIAESPSTVIGAKTINVQQAVDLYKNGAVFIDVRDEKSWSYGHINGAVHLDFNQDEFVVLYVSDALDKKTPIVFYCDSPLSTTGAMASFFAASWGYENVYYFREGYYSWLAYDMPTQFQGFEETHHIADSGPVPNLSVSDNTVEDY